MTDNINAAIDRHIKRINWVAEDMHLESGRFASGLVEMVESIRESNPVISLRLLELFEEKFSSFFSRDIDKWIAENDDEVLAELLAYEKEMLAETDELI